MSPHGTYARYCGVHKCRCGPCREARTAYERHRARQIAYGRWQPFVDAGPARAHARSLMDFGIGWRRVADAAGVQHSTMTRLLYGDRSGRGPSKRIRAESAEKILGVTASLDLIGETTPVDGTGTRRRIQALMAIGWSMGRLAPYLGMDATNVGRMVRGPRVRASKALMVREVYDRLWDVPPPEQDWREKISVSATRRRARERGWAPPLAWDDDTIDDPDAEPIGVGYRPLSKGKLPEPADVLHLVQGGVSVEMIAARYGVSVHAVKHRMSLVQEMAA